MSVKSWQHGCDDAKAGITRMAYAYSYLSDRQAYNQGYDFGLSLVTGEFKFIATTVKLKNPYMEAIEHIESILNRLQTFAKEYPEKLDRMKADEYLVNLLAVRDDLHRRRQSEIEWDQSYSR